MRMPNRDSDPPVSIPPIKNHVLVITTGKGGSREETLTIDVREKTLTLVVKRGDAVFTTPIDEANWSLEIRAIESQPAGGVSIQKTI